MSPLLFSAVLCFMSIASANIFEYEAETQPLRPCELQREKAFKGNEDYIPQCTEDGQFRNMQCNKNGSVCWCVDDKGAEVSGTRQSGSPLACLSFCQLEKQRILVSRYINNSATSYIPQCLDSGEFDPIQCDLGLIQCWCVDPEGMEIYGTRQKGKPKRCPGKCEIRDRRVLHGVGEKSPPQCSPNGEFLPVQCKFINTTDRMVFDLVHHFNRFPDAFLTFSSFRQFYPDISGYCYCADSLGRELEDTGLEMLVDNVYDTVFASLDPVRTFTETSMYRILQRRFLGVHLAMSGRFRCPSKCETERSVTIRFEQSYQPLCDENGAYRPTQCQMDGECWCADAKGQELLGTRSRGQRPACEEFTCVSERQESLSRLFYGPVGHFSQHNLFSASRELQNRTASSRTCPPSFKELFVDSGLLSSVLEKMEESQFLNLESLLSEAVGGMFPSRELAQVSLRFASNSKRFQENLFGGRFLKNLAQFNLTGAVGPNGKVNVDLFFQQNKMRDSAIDRNQSLVNSFGRTINLRDNQKAVQFLASLLEAPEFFTFLQHVISVPENIAQDLGEVARVVLKTNECTEQAKNLFVPACTKEGRYEEVQCYAGDCWCVDLRGKEIPGSRVRGGHPKCPTMCEKQRENLERLRKSQPAGSELFVPSCTQEGKFLPVQCLGRNCFCVDFEGRTIPGMGSNTGESIQCPTECQLAAAQAVLRTVQRLFLDPLILPQFSEVYIPQCSLEGLWRQVQCNGPPEQAFEWYQRWMTHNNNGRTLPFTDLVDTLLSYKQRTQPSFEGFVKRLYEEGHQNIFPELSKYLSFDAVPQGVLEGKSTVGSPENILLQPFPFWQLLQANLIRYPGSYVDFSTPLGHFELRNCWCVDERGQMQGDKANVNKVPDCPSKCEAARREAMQFVGEVEQLITDSNSAHFPFGQSFLMAKIKPLNNLSQTSITFSEKLLTGSDYAIRLAAQSTLQFYWRSLLRSSDSAQETLRLGFQPYVPQCDGLGNWEPVQCYESSGPGYCSVLRSKALQREIGKGYIPQCTSDGGTFSPVQWTEDQESYWCAFENGEEAPGTRINSKKLPCERPLCRLPFDAPGIINGGVFWLQPFQSVQTQMHFQLVLPPEKACSPDYSGLLEAFQIFILDDLKARGFCHIQVNALEHPVSVPVCDDSSVRVECLAADRLGVNVTWRTLLEDIPASLLPDLHNVEEAMVGENLVGRFESLVRSGGFLLHLDNKQFKADTSMLFFKNGDFSTAPQVQLGCRTGFQKVLAVRSVTPNLQGCVVCPPGTFSQNDSCVPCPSGFYQDQAGSLICLKCPLGKSTISVGAFHAEHCLTNCQRDKRGVPCDETGQYRPSYEDSATNKSFCVDSLGEILEWTETEGPLTDSQCLVLRRFEKIPATKLSFTTEEVEIVSSQAIQGEPQSARQQCVAECEQEESCGFLTLSVSGTETRCDLYSARESNYNCSASGMVQGAWDNPATTRVDHLTCLLKVKSQDQNPVGVYLKKESDMITRTRSEVCDTGVPLTETNPVLPASTPQLFSPLESTQILIDPNRPVPSQEYWLFKARFSAEEARLWCFARCSEDDFCQMVDIPNATTSMFFPCTLYPAAQVCDNTTNSLLDNCNIVLPQNPQLLYQKKVSLEGSVKNFYTRLPFRKMSSISVRNKMDVSGKTLSNGFLDCERFCDADPCCSGFGFLGASQGSDSKVVCLTLNSLGIQTCSEEIAGDWRVSDCASPPTESMAHPFGWYQKGTTVPRICPPVPLPRKQGNVTLDKWKRVDGAATLIDPSISQFDIMHVSRDTSSDFANIRDFCLSVCSKEKLCLTTTLEVRPTSVRCLFYPETQICTLDLQGHHCRLGLKEPATYIYRKQDAFLPIAGTNDAPSVFISSQGTLIGSSLAIQVGSSWKRISQFLGIPYATPPVAENRFRPPQAFSWAGSWNATTIRASCWQPGDGESSPSSVSEDCLYLNIYIPESTGGNLPVLVFFHNGLSNAGDQTRTVIDGSYLAGVGNLIVVTANYRVGVFGFLSSGTSVAKGNWGLLDQEAVLKWTQQNIASLGGDPDRISVAADGSGADVTSLHLLAGGADPALFKRMLLMGGSAFSPASTISKEKAQLQAAVLARELGCPSDGSEETISCLRQLPAKVLNDAQTRLLAISGPFQYWGPVVDGSYLQESPAAALQRLRPVEMDLLIGSAQQDGLISRAKAIKQFEESQGRANSKTAFYQALQNSLGGEDANPVAQAATTWFYSLQHSSTEYASFSRALENATRDHFIICPTIEMARHWARNGRGNVFMYHVPESNSLSSSSQEFLPDVQYAFGLPFHPQYQQRYPQEEKMLSLAIMQYLANFVKSGNPNGPYKFSRAVTGISSPWPMFRADTGGDNYKEFTASLENRKALKKAECSFWSDYIKPLKASISCRRGEPVIGRPTRESTAVSETTQMTLVEDKVAYSK
nr:thyroglobulin [Pogona vitticeps]